MDDAKKLEKLFREMNVLAETHRDAALMVGVWRKIKAAKPVAGVPVFVGSILSDRTKDGMVELLIGSEVIQMTLEKAREVRGMLDGAIEAAVSDGLIYRFLHERIGMGPETASRALIDFREMRQGSRETVFPQ